MLPCGTSVNRDKRISSTCSNSQNPRARTKKTRLWTWCRTTIQTRFPRFNSQGKEPGRIRHPDSYLSANLHPNQWGRSQQITATITPYTHKWPSSNKWCIVCSSKANLLSRRTPHRATCTSTFLRKGSPTSRQHPCSVKTVVQLLSKGHSRRRANRTWLCRAEGVRSLRRATWIRTCHYRQMRD